VLEDDTTGMQIEIPFVPAIQRQIPAVVEDKDTIVVVGKPKVKKRKRTKTLVVNEDKSAKNAGEGIPSVTLVESGSEGKDESFDFASVPNILDDNPDMEDRSPMKKKQKKQKKGQGTCSSMGCGIVFELSCCM
jgi:exosome complex exonuclease RRP6